MKKINHQLKASCLSIALAMLLLTSCNKEVEQLPAIATPVYPSGKGIAATIAANPNDSLYYRLLVRSGLVNTLNDSTKAFTLFAVDNVGMRLFATAASAGAVPPGAPDAVVSGFIANSLPVASATAIVQYNTLGQKFTASTFGTAFPNYPVASQIILDATQPFVRMPIFPVRGTPFSYVNNIPLTGVDQAAANGIIHHTFTIVSPLPAQPLTTLKTLINADANLTYFRAAITRADSGQSGISGVGAFGLAFDSLMNYPITNMTILAPNNAAFQTLIFGLAYQSYLGTRPMPYNATDSAIALATANGAVAAGPAFLATNNVNTASIRGILAYHILASNNTGSYKPDIRAFSVNFPSTPGFFAKTLVNGSVAAHPGIMAQATFSGPSVTALKFTGLGTFPPGGAPYSGAAANATSWDKIALNGVMHVIDRVLLPQ